MEWMILPYKRYFDFSGRSQRQEYWMFNLFWVLAIIFGVILIAAGVTRPDSGGGFNPLGWLGIAALMLFVLGSIIPSIAVTVRRFHDQDLSGWMYLLGFIPSIGWLVVFVFMCIDGNPRSNRFGYDPKGRGEAGVFD